MQPLVAAGAPWGPFAWIFLGLIGALGLLAVLSPRRFAAVANRGGLWVDTNKLLEHLDRRIDIDTYVLPFSRWLGVAVLASVAVIGYRIAQL